MTWAEFKKQVEASGHVDDDTELWFIDVTLLGNDSLEFNTLNDGKDPTTSALGVSISN